MTESDVYQLKIEADLVKLIHTQPNRDDLRHKPTVWSRNPYFAVGGLLLPEFLKDLVEFNGLANFQTSSLLLFYFVDIRFHFA